MKARCINLTLNVVPVETGIGGKLFVHKRTAPVFVVWVTVNHMELYL